MSEEFESAVEEANEVEEQAEEGKEEAPEGSDGEDSGEGKEKPDSEDKKATGRVFRKTLKVNGKEKEIELDLDDEDKLTQMIQKGLAADERFETAAQEKKRLAEMEELLEKADPREIFKRRGMSPQEWAEQILLEQLEEADMTEEQKELRALKREKEERAQAEKPVRQKYTQYLKSQGYKTEDLENKSIDELKSEAQAAYQEAGKVQESLDKEIADAWKDSGLPMQKQFALAIGQEMYGASLRGENLTAAEAAEIVRESWLENVTSTLAGMDAEAIQQVLGKDILTKLKKADIKRVSDRTSQRINTSTNRPAKAASGMGTTNTMTEREWEAYKNKLRSAQA